MINLRLPKVFANLLVLTFMAACSQQADNIKTISQLEIKDFSQPARNVFASGQPTKEELDLLAQAGTTHVINLRPQQEQDWNEGEYVESLGMQYHSIPVAGAAGVTVKNATQLAAVLKEIGVALTLVHCASGNRVGALIALGEGALNGKSTEEAIKQGKLWGLTSLEPVVRKKLSTP